MRFFLDVDNLTVREGRGFGPHISGITARLYSELELEFGFSHTDSAATLDLGSDIDLEVLLKRATGDQRYDDNVIALCSAFTRTAPGTDFFYTGYLDLASPGLQKLLGVDTVSRAESFVFTCVGDNAKSLAGTYLDVPTSTTEWKRAYFTVDATGTAPEAEADVTLLAAIDLNEDDNAVAVATALATAFAADADFTAVRVDDTVTFTSKTTGRRADAHAKTSGFTLTLLVAGATAFTAADEDEVDLNVEINFLKGGKIQSAQHFILTVENSLRRPGEVNPLYGGRVRTTTTAITNGVSTVPVEFATPLPSEKWRERSMRVFNTTDATPLNLWPGIVTERTAAGFIVELNANTDSGNYVLESTVELNP